MIFFYSTRDKLILLPYLAMCVASVLVSELSLDQLHGVDVDVACVVLGALGALGALSTKLGLNKCNI